MKKIVLLFISTAVSVVIYAQRTANIQNYIATYSEIAINEEMRSGVPAAITLAQGILESGCGQSDLCLKSNNHFGVKCKEDWTGPTTTHDDDLKGECFRVYANAAESYKDHSDFLKYRPYYVALFKLRQDDYRGWAYGLKKAGYATERDYPKNLIHLIETYNLQQYTLTALERMRNPDNATYAANNAAGLPVTATVAKAVMPTSTDVVSGTKPTLAEQVITNEEEDTTYAAPAVVAENDNSNEPGMDSYPNGTFTINGTKVIFAKAGTSLFAMASNYNVAFKTLLDYNELDNSDILEKDRLIYLERKPKKGGKEYHVVATSETLDDIAQKEGVRLESILLYNTLQKNSRPAAGTKIYLRLAQGTVIKAHKA